MKKHPLSDLDADIREHIDRETADNIERGMRPDDARASALRSFGNVALIKEDARAVWIPVWVEQLLQDARFAMRMMRRSPGFAAIAVGSSALGIGACSVIFAILNVAVFKPLPVEDPGHLMSVSEVDRRTGEAGNELSYPDFRDLRQARSFDGMAASNPLLPASIGLAGDPQRHWGALVTANYFTVVRPAFAMGRGFDPARDDVRGESPVVVLSHELWRRGFGSDPGIVGRTIAINQRMVTIIGVTAAGFRGTDVPVVPEFWIPLSMIDELESRTGQNSENRGRHWLRGVARLQPGVDPEAARAELDVIARTLNATAGPGAENRGFHLERAGQIDPRLRRIALTFFSVAQGVTALVLLTACVNVASLLLGRASARRREIAARLALGASRRRLLRQLLTESLVLALIAGAGGWMIAVYVSSLLGVLRTPLGWPLDLSISLDYRVLFFCVGLSILTGVLFGLVPALRATRPDLITDLKGDARAAMGGRFRLRSTLVVGQIAICAVLLICTGLFLRSLQSTRGLDLGLKNRDLLLLSVDPGLDRRTDPQARQLLGNILDRARALPGVESATLTTAVPLTVIINSSSFLPEESAADPQAPQVQADIYAVGPAFFATMGISFLAGDDFRAHRAATGKPVIVNEAFARAAFSNESPIGRRILGDGKALNIVGLVATAKSRTIGEAPRPAIYLPVLTDYAATDAPRGVTLVVKTSAGPASYAGALREAIRSVDPSLAVFDVRTMESHLSDASLVPRLTWALSAVAGLIAVALAMIGVYGVISSTVVLRRRELGIRLAIGARPDELLIMILRQGIMLALVGTGLGLSIALGVTRFAASLLYDVNPTDPATFGAVGVLLLAVALVACALPARAAGRLNPVDVLRGE